MQDSNIEAELVFTPNLYVGIRQMKENLFNELTRDVTDLRERALILEVICQFCEDIRCELDKCSQELFSILDLDNIYWRRRPKYMNKSLTAFDQFFHQQIYTILPKNPGNHCLNICIVNTLDGNHPYFYLRHPLPDLKVQHERIERLKKDRFIVGEYCYLLNRDWYSKWLNHVKTYNSNVLQDNLKEIGPISNEISNSVSIQDIVYCQTNLFIQLSEPVWILLLSWYGLSNRSIVFRRQILSCEDGQVELENTLIHLPCYSDPDTDRYEVLGFRYEETIESVLSKIRVVFRIPIQSQLLLYTRPNEWTEWVHISGEIISAKDLFDRVQLLIIKKTVNDWSLSISPCYL
ncbi:Ubiquitin carboxyl-terminal hydrolase 4 [Oopsacas minuta]|uniref:Ubiquitin carboxyl-terminal hydrolase 4 n=1 Tax=Oopsacas minuta TaxID=111878 RepID=A0AAV7KBM5_9METZ|nr:Ubiquitin carboxyl-terminal hydrolase 4 [Oopsacas minuta]